jgi:hypothetical protein
VKSAAAALLLVSALAGGESDLRTTSGAPFSLADMLARGPTVLVFWNSWLPESDSFLALLPEIAAAAERSGWPGAVVIFQDTGADAAAKLPPRAGSLVYVVDRRGELVRRFKVTRAPAVLLVEPSGAVKGRCGPSPDEVRELLRGMATQ